jgi:hypothetical protein
MPFALVPFLVLVIGKTLAAFAGIIASRLRIQYDVWFEIGMVAGQVLFQWLFMWRRSWPERREYALLLFFVSALGATLLWPLLLLHRSGSGPVSEAFALAWFFGVVTIMFAVHWVAVKRRRLPTFLCATWILYRLLILLFIVKRPVA